MAYIKTTQTDVVKAQQKANTKQIPTAPQIGYGEAIKTGALTGAAGGLGTNLAGKVIEKKSKNLATNSNLKLAEVNKAISNLTEKTTITKGARKSKVGGSKAMSNIDRMNKYSNAANNSSEMSFIKSQKALSNNELQKALNYNSSTLSKTKIALSNDTARKNNLNKLQELNTESIRLKNKSATFGKVSTVAKKATLPVAITAPLIISPTTAAMKQKRATEDFRVEYGEYERKKKGLSK